MNFREELDQLLAEEQSRAEAGEEKDLELVIRRGILHGHLAEYEQGFAALDEAERLEQEQGLVPSPRIPLNRGVLHMSMHHSERALEHLSRAENMFFARGQVVHPAVHVNRGAALRQLGNIDASLDCYERAEQAAEQLGIPPHHMLYLNRGVALTNIGRFEEALAALDKAEQVQVNTEGTVDSVITMNRGLVLAQMCHFEEADKTLKLADEQRAAAGQMLHPMVALNRAVLNLNRGDLTAALASVNDTHWRYGRLGLDVPEVVKQYEREILDRASGKSPQSEICKDAEDCGHEQSGDDTRRAANPSTQTDPIAAQPETTAFLSHRRREGHAYARLIKANFEMRGHRAFLDIDEKAPTPRFDERLLHALARARSFVLVLTPGALDRCVNEGDWLRREIRHAIGLRKNIVPVMMPEFKWPRVDELPEDIRPITLCEGLSYSHEYFAAFIDMLVSWCSRAGLPAST